MWCYLVDPLKEGWGCQANSGWGGALALGFQVLVLCGCSPCLHHPSPSPGGCGYPRRCRSHQLLRANPLISDSDKWVLLVDFRNAFNTIDRASMFEELRSNILGISPWMECCYGSQRHLIHGDYTIYSCSGVQQGDPLGPLCFSMALHPIVQRIVNEVPGLSLNAWYWYSVWLPL